MEVEIGDRRSEEAATGQGAAAASGGEGDGDHQQEVDGGSECHAPKAEPHATELVGVRVAAGNNGAGGDETRPSGSPSRDSTRGKGVIVEAEKTTEAPFREEDVLFRPSPTAATSSSHRTITKYDIAEHLPDEALAKLLEKNPIIGEIVLKAKEDQARAIAASEARRELRESERKERSS
ncbi:hypothetical protein RHMOL_Rhmol08G0219800 [Rhododendron molle]|uniref:Uncharacterized protein n=1 Tax=Rhododendron molle TaxID=49168 RepID=A0ACC0MR13_RHOML|nr:hypothetical protein RHMOL_Rhmol08G0219800 [Rhododendron molle]